MPRGYLGDFRAPLEKRGDVVILKNGDIRITREQRIGKEVRKSRDGRRVIVQVRVPVPKWVLLTKRTDSPKLDWLLHACRAAGLRVVRSGRSFHAPCTYVHRDDYSTAWAILSPMDDLPDNSPRFERHVTIHGHYDER
jgi:hypothetical protein